MPEPYQLLYLSRLAAHTTPCCVAEIVRAARQQNQAQGINSLLVFDGLRFCQYLVGEAATVLALAERIGADPRHTDFRVLYEGVLSGPSPLGRRRLAYALCYDDSLDRIERADGAQAITSLVSLLPNFDCEAESSRP
ncbi:MAG: BLUF domain-containing protein [Thiobacillus sp.]